MGRGFCRHRNITIETASQRSRISPRRTAEADRAIEALIGKFQTWTGTLIGLLHAERYE